MLSKQSFLKGGGIALEDEAFEWSLEELGLDFERQRLRSGKEERRKRRDFLERKKA